MQALLLKHPEAIGIPLGAICLVGFKLIGCWVFFSLFARPSGPSFWPSLSPLDFVSMGLAGFWGALLGGASSRAVTLLLCQELLEARDTAAKTGWTVLIIVGSWTVLLFLTILFSTSHQPGWLWQFLVTSVLGNFPLQWALLLLWFAGYCHQTHHGRDEIPWFLKYPDAIGIPLGAASLLLLKWSGYGVISWAGFRLGPPYNLPEQDSFAVGSMFLAGLWGAFLGGSTGRVIALLRYRAFAEAREVAGEAGHAVLGIVGCWTFLIFLGGILTAPDLKVWLTQFFLMSVLGNSPLQWGVFLLYVAGYCDRAHHRGIQVTENWKI